MSTTHQPDKRFKVALSFAGEQRDFVKAVAERLSNRLGRERVLYDHYYEAEFARPDLDTYLQRLYHEDSELIAVFICADYEKKEWCGLEWRVVRDLIKKREAEDIMPLRFDNTEIAGLFSIDGYVWINGRSPEEIAGIILTRSGVAPTTPSAIPPRIDLIHLPAGAEHFLGRDAELTSLDAAWASSGKTAIVELIAPGGTGKTALVKRWLDGMKASGWRGAQRVFGWSFYSQGTSDDRNASEDHFLAEALKWFGVAVEPSLNPWDKGRKLAEAIVASRTLLVLDGVEPLQYPPGPLAGELKAPGLQALLTHLASAGHPGLCVLSSREFLKDLAEWVGGAVRRIDLGNLADADGAKLLHTLGASKAGASHIASDDEELKTASREVKGHALTLSLLGRYLALAFDGDIRKRDQVDFREADAETSEGHAFRVMAAYEAWFEREGEKGARELAALRLFGFFDHPASQKSLRALRQPPAIAGLTRPLVTLKPEQWKATLKHLENCGLIQSSNDKTVIDAHPLIRDYLGKTLRERLPEAWKEGHKRIYEQLKTSVPHRPEGLAGLQPLYQAIAHGCQARLWQQACDEVYRDRILRGTGSDGFYSINKLGAIGADLGAVTCFFVEPWRRLAPALTEAHQAWLFNQAAFFLCALGRFEEALEPTQAGAEMWVKQEDSENSAISYINLSELQLSLGRITAAVADAEQAVDYADRSCNPFWHIASRTTQTNACRHQGDTEAALHDFAEAETMQAQRQPDYPLLYSLHGFNYCELMLAEAERAAWCGKTDAAQLKACNEVGRRAAQTLAWAKQGTNGSLLDVALDHLTLTRCALYIALLQNRSPDTDAQTHAETAISGLHQAGQQGDLPRGLLTRAWLRHCLGDIDGTAADLNEAHRIAARGGMKLHLADIALTRARLFHDRAELTKARALIEECGYGRRLGELEDAEAAAKAWTS